jgi:hypothetical protein
MLGGSQSWYGQEKSFAFAGDRMSVVQYVVGHYTLNKLLQLYVTQRLVIAVKIFIDKYNLFHSPLSSASVMEFILNQKRVRKGGHVACIVETSQQKRPL